MSTILGTMQSLTEELRRLEKRLDLREFEGSTAVTSLGEDPSQGFSAITEFKAAIDRMRYVTWMYMEAAARSIHVPVQAVPPALRQKINPHTCSIEEYLDGKERA